MNMPSTMHNQPIVVLCAVDASYAQHLGVMLCSLLENHPSHIAIEIYIIDGGLESQNRLRLTNLIEKYGVCVSFVPVVPEKFNGLKVSEHVSVAAYYRVIVGDILPLNYERALHLDADIVVMNSVVPLWEIDLGTHTIAAVIDPTFNRYAELGILPENGYFNSGVMVINLERWRAANVGNRVLEFVREFPDKIQYWDQDALNVVLNQDWLPIRPHWNVQANFFLQQRLAETRFGKEELRAALRRPRIAHFTTASKPWHFRTIHPWQHTYYHYLYKTPWRDYAPPDRTLLNMALKPMRIVRRRLLDAIRYWRDRYSVQNNSG